MLVERTSGKTFDFFFNLKISSFELQVCVIRTRNKNQIGKLFLFEIARKTKLKRMSFMKNLLLIK